MIRKEKKCVDFNQIVDRKGTHCTQWDYIEDRFGENNLLPFTISDTDFMLPGEVRHTLSKRLEHGIFGYTRWNHQAFQEAVLKWYRNRFNLEIKKEWLNYSPSVIYSISLLIDMHSDKHDGVIVQTPAYDAFFKTIVGNQRKLIENPLLYQNGLYSINFIELETKLSDPQNKILLLCSPHNPTGRVWEKEELKKIVELCKKYQVFLISDEIHMDIVRKEYSHHPILELSEQNVAIVTSGSKTFNFPGLIFSYVLLPSETDRKAFRYRLKNRDGLSSASTLGLEATISAYDNCENWVEELNEYIDGNIEYVKKELLKKMSTIKVVESHSTYLMWLDMTNYPGTMEEIQKKLLEIGQVAIMDGGVYGGNGRNFLRLNVGCPRDKVVDGLHRLIKSLN